MLHFEIFRDVNLPPALVQFRVEIGVLVVQPKTWMASVNLLQGSDTK